MSCIPVQTPQGIRYDESLGVTVAGPDGADQNAVVFVDIRSFAPYTEYEKLWELHSEDPSVQSVGGEIPMEPHPDSLNYFR